MTILKYSIVPYLGILAIINLNMVCYRHIEYIVAPDLCHMQFDWVLNFLPTFMKVKIICILIISNTVL